jgi:possible beta-lactamase class A
MNLKLKFIRSFLILGLGTTICLGAIDGKHVVSMPKQADSNDTISLQQGINRGDPTINKTENKLEDFNLAPSESAYLYMKGKSSTVHSHRIKSASMIKVFILSYLFEKVDKGEISLQDLYVLKPSDKVGGSGVLYGYESGSILTIDTLARLMIAESDNTATNILIDKLGLENINSYLLNQGYMDTQLNRKMMDLIAIDKGIENYTSAKDLGNWFLKLAKGELASDLANKKMIHYLLEQTDTECISLALPNRVIAHKTGELASVYHDGGIIYNGNQSDYYILVLLSDGYDSRAETIKHFQSIAKEVDYKVNLK